MYCSVYSLHFKQSEPTESLILISLDSIELAMIFSIAGLVITKPFMIRTHYFHLQDQESFLIIDM